jgi:hypothetical protein
MQAQRQAVVEEEAAGEASSFRVIEDLQTVGVNVADIKKLQEAGYTTIGHN